MKKRVLAIIMTLLLVLTSLPITFITPKAADTANSIILGDAAWIEKNVSYHFPSAAASFGEGQKIFCISVSNNGYFTIPSPTTLGSGSDIKVSGLTFGETGDKKYISGNAITENNTKLCSLTVISKSSDIAQIEEFLKNMKYYRNGVSDTSKQKVTVISNSVQLPDDMTVIAVDGSIHYYKYVPWDYTQSIDENRTWYSAYKNAKSDEHKFNGLKGYLATITSDMEQIYICNSLGLKERGAWVGGARTKTDNIPFDADEMTTLNPGKRIAGDMADTWYWMCGPEAGKSYYKIKEPGYYYQGNGSSDGCDQSYNYWYENEPNNTDKSAEDEFSQEYCMEYGYDEKGEWNDLWPKDGTNVSTKWKLDGYLIEYSPYTNTKVSPNEVYKESDESSLDTKIIPEALEENPRIYGNDFIVTKDEAEGSSEEDIKDWAGVTGTDPDGNNVAKENITSDTDTLKDVTDNKEITFKNEKGTDTTTKVTAYVVDKKTKGDDEKAGITIGANDFYISSEQEKNRKDADVQKQFKELAGVVATDSSKSGGAILWDSDEISVIEVKETDTPHVYDVTFSYEGVKVTVKATAKYESVTGNNFIVPAGGSTLTDDSFKEKADIDAKNSLGDEVKASVNSSDLEKVNDAITNKKKGEYPVEVSTPDGTSTTVTVTVMDESIPDADNKETISANNYEIGIEDYDIVTGADKLANNIKLANAIAYMTDTKEPVDIVDVDTSKIKNEPGTYDVTFKTAKGSSVTVKLTINSDWKTVGDVDKASEANKQANTTSNPTAVKNVPNDTNGPEQVFEKTNPKDISEKLDSGKEVDKVLIDDKDLPSGSYNINEDSITIKSSAFSGFKADTVHPVQIVFKDGSKHSFNVRIIEYDEKTVIKKVPILKLNKKLGIKQKFTLNIVGINKTAKKIYKSSNKKIATINSKGVITGKKKGKCKITAYIIQNGSYYKVKVNLTVKKNIKNYNLKPAALSKKMKGGQLPEFNVYKRVFKGKKTKLKFTNVEKKAKISYTSKNKKIAKVTKKGVITGKKKGVTVVTAKITQNGKTYVTRVFVRVDDNTTLKNIKKYLKF